MIVYPSLDELVSYIPADQPTNLRTLYLAAWYWIVEVAHLAYDNHGGNRCGEHGHVDCSGGCALAMNIACAALGLPQPFTCEATNSYWLASLCYDTPRPTWMTQLYGDMPGTFLPLGAAMDLPACFGFHGNNWGRSPDSNGDGHINSSYYGHNVSVEARSHAAGVVFAEFVRGPFIQHAAIPPMLLPFFAPAPLTVEEDMLIVQFAGFPAIGGQQPLAQFVPANSMFPKGGVVLRNGARIKGDLGTTNPHTHIWVPQFAPGAGKTWVSMCVKPSGKGLTLFDDASNTTEPTQGDLVLPAAA